MAKMDSLRDEEHRETAGELPTRLIYDGERYGTEDDAKASRLAVMDRRCDGPVPPSWKTASRWAPTSIASEEGTRSTTLEGRGCLFVVLEIV